MESLYLLFDEYANNYDMLDKEIIYKYEHTYRVVKNCKNIATSLNLSDEDIKLAMLCGLLHDIGRFEQWTKQKSYEDGETLDHGDYGYEVLLKDDYINEYTNNEEEKRVILISVKYHNKYEIPTGLSEKEELFLKITRDADKIDIMYTQGNKLPEDYEVILKEELLSEVYNRELCKNIYITRKEDDIIRQLAWIYDFNYKYSIKYLNDLKIFDYKLELLSKTKDQEKFNTFKQFIKERIGELIC